MPCIDCGLVCLHVYSMTTIVWVFDDKKEGTSYYYLLGILGYLKKSRDLFLIRDKPPFPKFWYLSYSFYYLFCTLFIHCIIYLHVLFYKYCTDNLAPPSYDFVSLVAPPCCTNPFYPFRPRVWWIASYLFENAGFEKINYFGIYPTTKYFKTVL